MTNVRRILSQNVNMSKEIKNLHMQNMVTDLQNMVTLCFIKQRFCGRIMRYMRQINLDNTPRLCLSIKIDKSI